MTLPAEFKYIGMLFEHVKSGENAQIGLQLVIPACKAKIVSHAKTLAKRFDLSKTNLKKDQHDLWNYKSQNPFHQKIREALIEGKLVNDGDSISNYLDGYLRAAASLGKDSPLNYFQDFLNFSYALSEETELEKVLTIDQTGAIHKLGEYCRALHMLRDMQEKVVKRNQSMKYQQVSTDKDITFAYLADCCLQIIPPALREVKVFSGTLGALNLRTRSGNTSLSPLSGMEAVLKPHLKAVAGSPATGKTRVKVTQHAEIIVALDMFARFSREPMTFEIGVSERSCYWCDKWLGLTEKAIGQRNFHVVRRGTYGKQPDGWGLPASVSFLPEVESQMRYFIIEKVDTLLNTVEHRHRRSDSIEMERLSKSRKREDDGQGSAVRFNWV